MPEAPRPISELPYTVHTPWDTEAEASGESDSEVVDSFRILKRWVTDEKACKFLAEAKANFAAQSTDGSINPVDTPRQQG